MNARLGIDFGLLRGPRDVLFGVGQRHALPAVVQGLGRRALVVTDPRLASGRTVPELVDGCYGRAWRSASSTRLLPELPLEQVPLAVDLARRHGADVVVGLGGGSCIDLAKVVALLLGPRRSSRGLLRRGPCPWSLAPVVAVPTTAGTGSEVTPVAVVTDPSRTIKVGISSPHLIPAVALCDPELTVSCPRAVTAAPAPMLSRTASRPSPRSGARRRRGSPASASSSARTC